MIDWISGNRKHGTDEFRARTDSLPTPRVYRFLGAVVIISFFQVNFFRPKIDVIGTNRLTVLIARNGGSGSRA